MPFFLFFFNPISTSGVGWGGVGGGKITPPSLKLFEKFQKV